MTASGLTSTAMASRNGRSADQDLDTESADGLARLKAKDAEIDKGLDAIGNQLDTLGNIARTIKDEVALLHNLEKSLLNNFLSL